MYQTLFAATLVFIAGYLATFAYLMRYLRRFHPATWGALGHPAFPNLAEHAREPWPFVRSGFLTFIFIFSGAHRSLGDRRLDRLIWTIRSYGFSSQQFPPIIAV